MRQLQGIFMFGGNIMVTPESENPQVSVAAGQPPGAPKHPLDSLSFAEMEETVRILANDGRLSENVRVVSISLMEPAKHVVEAYRQGSSFERRSFAVLLDRGRKAGFESIVDLLAKSVVSFTQLPPGVQPPIMLDEFGECEEAVKRSPEFLAVLQKRGITDADLVMVEPWSAGTYGTELPEDKGRRLMRALCFVRSEPRDNGYARPLGGIVVVVDLNQMEVVRIEDYGVVPLPPESANWSREYIPDVRNDLKPVEIVQPQGPSFTVEGHEVRWQKWKFRVSFTAREGLVLHTISYHDNGVDRPILYRASVCEMVVPYADPGEQFYRKNAFDIGEYGIGMLANSLVLNCDCLGVIHYFDFPLVNSKGHVYTLKHAVCLHEEDFGLLWKHTDWRSGQSEVRRSRRLSVSFIATVGNYEYGFFWYFYQDGTLQCEIKLTGILNTTSLAPGERPLYGVEISPRLNAPFHEHIFAARLVASVDGPKNSVYEVNTASTPRGPGNPYGNAFRAEATLLASEKEAQRHTSTASGRFWRIVNPERKNRLGQPVAYRLIPGENCSVFAQSDAALMLRAGFTRNHLWITPYRENERFPAGDYPNQHPAGDGLPVWTAANRSIDNTEVVVWYVFAHNHVPRMEDWPVMPAAYIGFQLKPDGFFAMSPAMDLPPTKKACEHDKCS
jgi:primary-amine oxidase